MLLSGFLGRLLLLAQGLLGCSERSHLPLGLLTGGSRGLLLGLRIGPCGIQLTPNLGNFGLQLVARDLGLPKPRLLLLNLLPVLLGGLLGRLLLLAQGILGSGERGHLPFGRLPGGSRSLLSGLRISPCGIQLASNLGNLSLQLVARGLGLPKPRLLLLSLLPVLLSGLLGRLLLLAQSVLGCSERSRLPLGRPRAAAAACSRASASALAASSWPRTSATSVFSWSRAVSASRSLASCCSACCLCCSAACSAASFCSRRAFSDAASAAVCRSASPRAAAAACSRASASALAASSWPRTSASSVFSLSRAVSLLERVSCCEAWPPVAQ